MLRAAILIGAGGISWEITRQLVHNLPAMITPRWVQTRTQPIAADDVVRYLVGVLGVEEAIGRVFEIGGPEVLRYSDMMKRLAKIQGRPLVIAPVPLLSPGLSSRWLGLVTDVDHDAARDLVGSMSNEVVVDDDSIRSVVPFEPMGYDEAVRQALAEHESASRHDDALARAGPRAAAAGTRPRPAADAAHARRTRPARGDRRGRHAPPPGGGRHVGARRRAARLVDVDEARLHARSTP